MVVVVVLGWSLFNSVRWGGHGFCGGGRGLGGHGACLGSLLYWSWWWWTLSL